MRGPSLVLRQQIVNRVAASPGMVWTPIDFLGIGPRAAVDKTLQRLVVANELCRLDRGLYCLPRTNSLAGRSNTPDTRAIIDAVVRRDQARLVVDGLTAANELGLTTAVPTEVIVLSDARIRPIELSNQTIRFKQAAPSRLYWAGRPAMRVVQALHWAQGIISTDGAAAILSRLREIFADPARGTIICDDLREGFPTLPIWMQSHLRDLLDEADPILALPLPPRKAATRPGASRTSR
jgi:hypothetical protein